MYSWSGSTRDWRGPRRYDYGSARRAYTDDPRANNPRTYNRPREPNMDLVNPKGKDLVSNSPTPIIVGIDITGSMADWPGEIFDRLPLFCKTLAKYKPDVEILFSAIGDAYSDRYPLQVGNFKNGLDLEEELKALYPEGGGGGQAAETYELWGHYMLNHVETPNATEKPFLIIFGDEGFYPKINPNQVRHYIGDHVDENDENLDSRTMWKALSERFNIYMLHKPYDVEWAEGDIVEQWRDALTAEKVVPLDDKERAVDIALGLISRNWGHLEDFEQNLGSRQEEDVVERVVETVGNIPLEEEVDQPGITINIIDSVISKVDRSVPDGGSS